MSKKKGNDDLTRIEDLSEFLHVEDSDLDLKFADNEPESINIDELLDEEDSFSLPEIPTEEESQEEIQEELKDESEPSAFSEEVTEEITDEYSNDFTTSEESLELSFGETSEENDTSFSFESTESEAENESETSFFEDNTEEEVLTHDFTSEEIEQEEPYIHKVPEKFEEVRVFAQNFSYGKATLGGGNPPFSLIVKNLKYKEDAEDILNLFEELGIVNESNFNEFKMSLNLGSLIVPQISEYTAIVLAHKLRKYDLDIIVGLSDEVHPPKDGDQNSRGLVKKENVKQNRKESFDLEASSFEIEDIIVTTTSQIEGHTIVDYLGVETVFTIIEESELEKLQYVEKVEREGLDLFPLQNEEGQEFSSSTEQAFKDFKHSFNYLYQDLKNQLLQKAFLKDANALINLSYQLSPIQYERNYSMKNAYQILCSATMVKITKN